ncbi:MAG: DUF2515 domain-containing protein [Myxococcales bacterium]|nr:DUF2515 domain-containing protein [Myxococcales bacterium]
MLPAPVHARLDAWLGELDARNADNVTRTDSYLELYAWCRGQGLDLPWIFMAHLVSRNAGYLMTDLARHLDRGGDPALASASRWLFVLLERANFLIFWDAWWHLGHALAGRREALTGPRTPRFMLDAWARFDAARAAAGGEIDAALHRALVIDLVTNEQNLIERRVVHHPDLAPGRRLLELVEASGRERPLHVPIPDAPAITVGGFAHLHRRIAAGARIYDEVLVDRGRRDALLAWALAHPHTGSRAVYGGKDGPTVREAWPVETVRGLWPAVHAPAEPDPDYP